MNLPATEAVNPRTTGLDLLATPQLVAVLAHEQEDAARAVSAVGAELAAVVDRIAKQMRNGGRLHYVGAGSSGRIAMLDAAEMPPTFGADPQAIQAHVAGGAAALTRAIEGAEDDERAGERAMECVRAGDAVVGLSASGSARFVIGALRAARASGAYTVAVVNSQACAIGGVAEQTLLLATGAEAIAGSTRLKAATAQKILLNTLSTAVMIRLNKVYGNAMVDLQASNEKLRRRALLLVEEIGAVSPERAAQLLQMAGGNAKRAILMARAALPNDEAQARLEASGGSLRAALNGL